MYGILVILDLKECSYKLDQTKITDKLEVENRNKLDQLLVDEDKQM